MGARHVVATLAVVDLIAWVLALAGMGGTIPSHGYVVFDIALESVLLIGLWFLWRVAWWVALVSAVLGEVLAVAHLAVQFDVRRLVFAAVGVVYLGLLMLPQLRHSVGPIRTATGR